jgi:hypothetical protein
MTYFEAALLVLKASNRPLSTAEILDRIERRKLISVTGQTPVATLAATLYRHLGKHPELLCERIAGPQRAVRGSVRWTVVRPNRKG